MREDDLDRRTRLRRAAASGISFALPYFPFFASSIGERSIPGAIFVAYAGIFAPGAAFVLQPGPREAGAIALRFLLGMTLLNVAAVVIRWVTGVPATPAFYAAILGTLTAATAFVGSWRGGGRLQPHRPTALVGLLALSLATWAGMRVVPPLEDQDMEVQGTANGIIYDLEPFCLTNRGTLHFIAHPSLLHFLNASTLTLANQLETVRPAWEVAHEELERLSPELQRPGWRRTVRAFTDLQPRPDRTIVWMRGVYGPFLKSPALLGTRAPNFVLASVLAMVVFAALRRIGASTSDAALLTFAQATLPEVFVRSAYGGYFALSAVTLTVAAWLAARSTEPGGARPAFGAGVLAMLANHKSVILGAGSLVLGGRRAKPLVAGLLVGGLIFAAYGLTLAPEEFVSDHLLDHGFARFRGGTASSYPSGAGLWLEFARNYGWVWCALVATGLAVAGVRAVRRRGEDVGEVEAFTRIAVGWVVVGAIVFTAADWRQTKHLSKLVPAMTIALGALFANSPRLMRLALRAALVVAIAWNVSWIVKIAQDFKSFQVTPIW